MGNIKPQTLKGFRDFLPAETRKRQYVVTNFKKAFEMMGFEELQTPALEYEEILAGKYGEEGDKLMYRFEDNGGRRVAMRYDQTVPLARVVAEYGNELPMPFKRYQIQPVWRAENTQKGRFREFLQCDADIVGSSSPLADAEVILTAAKGLEGLGFTNYKILINDRENLAFTDEGLEKLSDEMNVKAVRAIDKLKKVGREGVLNELLQNGFSPQQAEFILKTVEEKKPTERLEKIFQYLREFGLSEDRFEFYPMLARGLDYYTGLIFEIEIEGYDIGSVCGGGRYDNLIGMFSRSAIPAVGFAYGFDRVIEAMEGKNLFHDVAKASVTRVMVTVFSPELLTKSMELVHYLRKNKFNAELYDDPNAKLEKQIKYADKKGIMYAAIIGPEEAKNGTVTIKNLRVRDQQTVKREDLLKVI